jgi:hypothetical protein
MDDVMGRLIGSVNRERPFNSALLIELRSNPSALRRIAAKLVERAEDGELAAIEGRFLCQVCGKRGADAGPDFNWNKKRVSVMA